MDTRCGYGCLFKSSGDQFEGMWLNNKREGKGSYFFKDTNKMIVGEWVDDCPNCVVYCDIKSSNKIKKEIDFKLKKKNDKNIINEDLTTSEINEEKGSINEEEENYKLNNKKK